jgi:hypothetical protein
MKTGKMLWTVCDFKVWFWAGLLVRGRQLSPQAPRDDTSAIGIVLDPPRLFQGSCQQVQLFVEPGQQGGASS